MDKELFFDVAANPPEYKGCAEQEDYSRYQIDAFNQRHLEVMRRYGLEVKSLRRIRLSGKTNERSNLGVFRNKQLYQSVLLSAALPAISVAFSGRGAFAALPAEQQTQQAKEYLKRANDRCAAQVMGETIQITTDSLETGEDVVMVSAITEGARAKPGYEAGGNPTIAVGAVYGKSEHRARYGRPMPKDVTLLSMGNDVIDGTTKSVLGTHSSLTAVFVTESHVKRHLPDIYVQRWAAGVDFPEFNPSDSTTEEIAELIAAAYKLPTSQLSAFFIKRPRHEPPIKALNKLGMATPYDSDGDLFPGILLGAEGLEFPGGPGLMSMIGEIGGSAEWAVGVLPLVWRGGNAIGKLTSQSSLSRKDLSPEALWEERFHYTEDELLMIQDSRFELKPYFTIRDILEDPFAGGLSAFGAITDNIYYPGLRGVALSESDRTILVNVLSVNSLGITDHWEFTFECTEGWDNTRAAFQSPKAELLKLSGKELERHIWKMVSQPASRETYRIFFENEYYPALAHSMGQVMVLGRTVDSLIQRGALQEKDLEIIKATRIASPEWFVK